MQINLIEKSKIDCAERLFKTMSNSKIKYGKVTNYTDLFSLIQELIMRRKLTEPIQIQTKDGRVIAEYLQDGRVKVYKGSFLGVLKSTQLDKT